MFDKAKINFLSQISDEIQELHWNSFLYSELENKNQIRVEATKMNPIDPLII